VFQEKHGLEVTGKIDQKTKGEIEKAHDHA
jgi:hypothetical protein